MIKTLQDVEVFITTLDNTNMLWHADDLVEDIPNFAHLTTVQRARMQDSMDSAIEVCKEHDCDIFDFYPDLED